MRTQLPRLLVLVFGLFLIFQYFVPHEKSEWVYEYLLDWILIIGAIALAVGIWSLFTVSVGKIKSRKPHWGYNYLTLIGLFSMLFFGFTTRTGESWGWFFVFLAAIILTMLMVVQAMVSKTGKLIFLVLAAAFFAAAVLIGAMDDSWGFFLTSAEALQSTMFRAFFDNILIPIFSSMFALLAFFIASAAYRAFRARNLMASLLLLAALIVMSRFNPYLPWPEYISKASNWLMNVPNMAAQRAIVIGVGLGIVATALKVILGIERGYMGKG
jgi:hypothetical protein